MSPPKGPETPIEEAARKLLATDPKAFFAQLERLEQNYDGQVDGPSDGNESGNEGDGVAATPAEEDAGTARCVELCELLLEQWAAEDTAKGKP